MQIASARARNSEKKNNMKVRKVKAQCLMRKLRRNLITEVIMIMTTEVAKVAKPIEMETQHIRTKTKIRNNMP